MEKKYFKIVLHGAGISLTLTGVVPQKLLQGKPLNEALKPIQWLEGRWMATNGQGSYPNIAPFSYCEQVEFSSVGQPVLNYTAHSWHPEKQNAMHLESGFLRIKPGTNQLAFMVAHNFGLTIIEEGEVLDKIITLSSTHISRMSFTKGPQVTKLVRTWSLQDHDTLEEIIQMETDKTPLTDHLHVTYKKI